MTLTTIGETTFEFRFNKEKTGNYDSNGSMEVETYDVLVNGNESTYCVQFDSKLDSYSLWKTDTDRNGTYYRELIPFGINGKSGFPINVVCDIIKVIDTNWVR